VTSPDVRPARARDLPKLAAIEDAGVAQFEAVFGDLTGDALASPAPIGGERSARDGFLMVAGEEPVGFVHVLFLDGQAHLEQLSVLPSHQRRGIGTALVEAACERLAARGFGGVTLMTYADVAWNAPFYGRRGFVEVPGDERRADYQLRLVEAEEALGLARHGRRVLMRRALRRHRTTAELMAYLPVLDAAPKDVGTVRLVVRRTGPGRREVLEVGRLDLAEGLVGDGWRQRGSSRTADGSAVLGMQLNVMSHRMVAHLAQEPEREALAGDQLYLDLDLSEDNLPPWTRLALGDPSAGPEHGAVIVVTDVPHTGCAKFIARFGQDAMRFVNGPEGRPRRLRGLCARVETPGTVRAGDRVLVVRGEDHPESPATDE
jgi:ribosomal protein S18 acetylase RimI-like enzyme